MKKLIAVLVGVLLLLPSLTMALEPFNKDLRYGMTKNAEVRRMQEFLRDEGLYKGAITGNYYTLTRDAVRKYQKNNGLKVTGLFDKVTRSKVNEGVVVVSEEVSPTPVVDSSPSSPVGWIANGDGTFSPPSTYQPSTSQPQTLAIYDSQPIAYVPPNLTNDNQIVVTQPTQPSNSSSETRAANPSPFSSMPTSTPTTTPTMIAMNSTVVNLGFHPSFPTWYPFYAYVNCSPTSTDNRLLVENIMDNGYREQDILASNYKEKNIGFYTVNDPITYNNDMSVWEKPVFFDILNKTPKLKSFTIKNLGTANLKNINLKIAYTETPVIKDSRGNPRITHRGDEISVLPSLIDSKTATFDFPIPPIANFLTQIYIKGDLGEIKKLETIDFQITDVQLQNNDPTKIYSVKLPVEVGLDGVTKKKGILTKCDLKS